MPQIRRMVELRALGLSYGAAATVAQHEGGVPLTADQARHYCRSFDPSLPHGRRPGGSSGPGALGRERGEMPDSEVKLRLELYEAEREADRLDRLAGKLARRNTTLERSVAALTERLARAEKDADGAWRKVDELNGCQPEWSEYAA